MDQTMSKELIILGGGIAGLSLAHFLDRPTTILEAQEETGGLCRSFNAHGIFYDVGPHILFSKNQETLDFVTSLIPTNKIRRSNQIYYNGRFIKYPFENFLAQLGNPEEIQYCLNTFLNNPYREMRAENMLAFFLKTFGEGITRIYLQPYNEKIWKFDPAMMNTEMVERIPRPPDQDIIDSCAGKFSEGYLHQLYFHYPKEGGVMSLCNALREKIGKKSEIVLNARVKKIRKANGKWEIGTTQGKMFETSQLINCMPLYELIPSLENVPDEIQKGVADLKYNSIHVVIINVKKDTISDHFSMMFPQREIIFHRLNRLNFLGENYCLQDGSATFLAEVTFRKGTRYSEWSPSQVAERVVEDMAKLGFIDKREVQFTEVRTEKYAYVIGGLDSKKNKATVLSYLQSIGIESAGRFAQFQYLNSDQVIDRTRALAQKINGQRN